MQKQSKQDEYKGHHNGTVKGKPFEQTRRERVKHAIRKANIASRKQ